MFKITAGTLEEQGFTIVAKDEARPWGGFFVIDEAQSPLFIETYFPGLPKEDFYGIEKLSPKFLMVAPGKRLSWQYHHRRAELWRLVAGRAGVVKSKTDEEGEVHELEPGEVVRVEQGERHRLVGLESWGTIAEIWQHTDPLHPSDEDDIVRVQDDFGRQPSKKNC
ncbi:MAG: cupin domain-containing protein [Saprospiraceae bacterium]|nr:MAG: cupin domain-containing protein [Saprospiraceae bacterium]